MGSESSNLSPSAFFMNIPFADLPAQYRSLKGPIDEAIQKVLDTGQYIQGDAVRGFEAGFAAALGSGHCIATGSGTDAVHLALWAMGVGRGDLVATVPYTFIATVEAILLAGARPVFTDIDPVTFTMDPGGLERLLEKTPGVKAVLPVHLYGQPAPMDELLGISGRHGVPLVEDAAQAHMAKSGDTFAGNFGRAGAFSFYPAKNLGAFGEAGAVTTDDDELASLMRRLRDHGQVEKYRHSHWGHNYRMDSIQGAVLGVKLTRMAEWTARRREMAAVYNAGLSGLSGLTLPVERPGTAHVYHLYVVRVNGSFRRDDLRSHLSDHGISSALHYPVPLHLQEGLRFLGYREGDFPVSESAAAECLALPLYPEMSDEQVGFLLETVRAFFRR
jgi:dTDP-4-amino-4,6-dideoxygalactose transaminase